MWMILLLVDMVMGGGFGSHLASSNSLSDPLALHIVGGGNVFMDLRCASQVQEICKGKKCAMALANFCGPSPRCRVEPTNFNSALHGWAGGKDWALHGSRGNFMVHILQSQKVHSKICFWVAPHLPSPPCHRRSQVPEALILALGHLCEEVLVERECEEILLEQEPSGKHLATLHLQGAGAGGYRGMACGEKHDGGEILVEQEGEEILVEQELSGTHLVALHLQDGEAGGGQGAEGEELLADPEGEGLRQQAALQMETQGVLEGTLCLGYWGGVNLVDLHLQGLGGGNQRPQGHQEQGHRHLAVRHLEQIRPEDLFVIQVGDLHQGTGSGAEVHQVWGCRHRPDEAPEANARGVLHQLYTPGSLFCPGHAADGGCRCDQVSQQEGEWWQGGQGGQGEEEPQHGDVGYRGWCPWGQAGQTWAGVVLVMVTALAMASLLGLGVRWAGKKIPFSLFQTRHAPDSPQYVASSLVLPVSPRVVPPPISVSGPIGFFEVQEVQAPPSHAHIWMVASGLRTPGVEEEDPFSQPLGNCEFPRASLRTPQGPGGFWTPPLAEVLDRFSGPPVVEEVILATGMHLETIMEGRNHQKILKNANKMPEKWLVPEGENPAQEKAGHEACEALEDPLACRAPGIDGVQANWWEDTSPNPQSCWEAAGEKMPKKHVAFPDPERRPRRISEMPSPEKMPKIFLAPSGFDPLVENGSMQEPPVQGPPQGMPALEWLQQAFMPQEPLSGQSQGRGVQDTPPLT